MLLDPMAIAVAAVFALVALLPLSGRNLLRPLTWLCLIVGAMTWFLAREAPVIVWDEWLRPISGLGSGTPGLILRVMIAAAVGEILKATAPLAAVSFVPTDAPTGIAYGAAAGAGFGLLNVWPGIVGTIGLLGKPIATPVTIAVALVGWFFFVLAHVATTAYITRAGVRGGLGVAFFTAWLLQGIIGLAEGLPLPLIGDVPAKTLITAIIAVWLYVYLWIIRARSDSEAVMRS